jgi:hypothetical protein
MLNPLSSRKSTKISKNQSKVPTAFDVSDATSEDVTSVSSESASKFLLEIMHESTREREHSTTACATTTNTYEKLYCVGNGAGNFPNNVACCNRVELIAAIDVVDSTCR